MCYPKPGPRCAGHIRQSYRKVSRDYDTISKIVDKIDEEPEWDDSEKYPQIAKERTATRQKLESLAERKKELNHEWDITETGRVRTKELQMAAASAGDTRMAEIIQKKLDNDERTYDRKVAALREIQAGAKNTYPGANKGASKEELDKNEVIANYKLAGERSAAAESWMNQKPEETRQAWMVSSKSDGTVQVHLHGGANSHSVRQAYVDAGNDPEGVTFVPAEDPAPALNDMPTMTKDEYDAGLLTGVINAPDSMFVSSALMSDTPDHSTGVRAHFSQGVSEPTLVRGENGNPQAVMLPGEPRSLGHVEKMTVAKAAGSRGKTHVFSGDDKTSADTYDPRKLHRDITRGKVSVGADPTDPSDARKMAIEEDDQGPNLDPYEGLKDTSDQPRPDRRQPRWLE